MSCLLIHTNNFLNIVSDSTRSHNRIYGGNRITYAMTWCGHGGSYSPWFDHSKIMAWPSYSIT